MDMTITPLGKHQVEEAGRVAAGSLLFEPGFAAVLPDERKRSQVMTPLMTGTVRQAVRYGSAYGALGDGRMLGVAVWLPPGAYPYDLMTNLRMIPALRGMIHSRPGEGPGDGRVREQRGSAFPQ
jgi:hypothetical protein